MITVSLTVTAVAIIVIYHISIQNEKAYLRKLSNNEYRIIKSYYKHTGSKERVLAILSEQQKMYPVLEKSGEFVISEQHGDSTLLIYYEGI